MESKCGQRKARTRWFYKDAERAIFFWDAMGKHMPADVHLGRVCVRVGMNDVTYHYTIRDMLRVVVGRARMASIMSSLPAIDFSKEERYEVRLIPGLLGYTGFQLTNAANSLHGCTADVFAGPEAVAMGLAFIEGECPIEALVDWCGERRIG